MTKTRTTPTSPIVIWWAFERQLRNDKEAVIELLSSPDVARAPLVTHALLERVSRALASGASDIDFELCARLLAVAPGEEQIARILTGMEKGLEGRRLDHVPPPLVGPLSHLWDAPQSKPSVLLIRVAARLGSAPAVDVAARRCGDPLTPEADRIALIELLGEIGRTNDLSVLTRTLKPESSQPIRLAAIAALGHFHEPALAASLLNCYRSGAPVVRDRVLSLMCSRPVWTKALLDAIGAASSPPRT